jgi:hypothetical protein
MQDSQTLADQAARGIAASTRTSATLPGQTEEGRRADPERIEAINQVFALFRLNYHNQYYAAFPDAGQLKQIKRLWLESLADYSVEQILRGAKHALETCEYLPTLKRMHDCCEESLTAAGLPSARDAYKEACNAPSPRRAQRWSHPAVYLAGADTGWFLLSHHSERETWPLFRERYLAYCTRVARGDVLALPAAGAASEEAASAPAAALPAEEQRERLRALRERNGL